MKQGMVQSVETFVAGEAPLETAPVGATTIAFEDAGDFDEEGGQVNINGVILSYDSADLEEEVEAIHLSEPLAFEVTVQDMVLVHPEASETIAVVTDQDGTIEAIVPHALRAFFPEGPRDPEAGEMVLIADDEYGRPTIQNVEGRSPEMDARFVSNADELLLENQRYLGDVLSQNEAAITNAEGRLSTAEGRIVDAFDEIELKPDQAYVDAAKQQALDAAEAAEDRALSRGTDLVTNGTGYLGSNYNFPSLTYTQADAPTGATGSFVSTVGTRVQGNTAENIPVDTTKAYKFSVAARMVEGSPTTGALLYTFFSARDAFDNEIRLSNFDFRPGTTTTLAEPLNPGDTTMTLTSTANWQPGTAAVHLKVAKWWDYVDPAGKAWPKETYTRTQSGNDFYTAIDGNVITLRMPYTGPARPAGTWLSNGSNASSYFYTAWSGAQPSPEWETRTAIIAGTATAADGGNSTGTTTHRKFPPGTASIKIGWITNYSPQAGANMAIAGISLSDASAAKDAADQALSDAETKSEAAKQAAIDAAADDAAAKAAAAQAAAEQAAQEALAQAQADLQQAIASGDAAAIADAEAKIATAKQEAITAAANDATAKAGEAMQKANAALTAAQSAQATADNAIRTYYSEAPPWESNTSQPDDVLGDMWYQDSTGQAYRWNGTSWKVIQDASIGEALAAAANAQTTADGKITAFYQPNEPLEADEGDLWFDTDDDSALHRRTGGQWVALLDPKALADEAESNAKAFATTRTDGLAKTLWSTSLPGTTTAPQDSVWYQVDGDGKIIAVFTQTAAGSAGNTWVARPITSEAIDNLDVGKLTASSGTVNDLVANTFAAKLADIIEANIGNLTVTGDTHLEDLVAQTIAGDTASFMSLTVDQILAGFLQAQWIITESGAIIAGNPDGARVEIRHDGVRVYVVGPNGEPYEAVSMVNGEISFGVIGQDGTRLGGIASDGSVTGVRGSFSKDINVKGLPLTGQLGGGTIPGHLDNLPRGVLQRNFKSTPESSIVTGVERLYLRLNATLLPGRLYRLNAWMRANLAAQGGALTLSMRWSTTGPATLSSAQVPGTSTFSFPNASANHRIVGQAEAFIEVDVVTKARFVLTYKGDYGATPAATLTNFYIEDVGPSAPITGGDDEGGADTTLYRSTWRATASRMYDKTGARLTDRDNEIATWFWGGTPTDFQGSAWVYGGGAVEATDSIEMGKTLPQALGTSTIHKVEVYLRNKTWVGDVTEGSLALGSLAAANLPTTKGIDATLWRDGLDEGDGVWIQVPNSWFTAGSNRGVTLGDKDGQALNGSGVLETPASGSFHGPADSDPPLLRVTYSR